MSIALKVSNVIRNKIYELGKNFGWNYFCGISFGQFWYYAPLKVLPVIFGPPGILTEMVGKVCEGLGDAASHRPIYIERAPDMYVFIEVMY